MDDFGELFAGKRLSCCGDSARGGFERSGGKGEKEGRCRLSKVRAPIGRVNFRPH
jgi:hypothetical protein